MPRICCCIDVIVVAARARENGDRTDDGVAAKRARGQSARAESVIVRKMDAIAALCVWWFFSFVVGIEADKRHRIRPFGASSCRSGVKVAGLQGTTPVLARDAGVLPVNPFRYLPRSPPR